MELVKGEFFEVSGINCSIENPSFVTAVISAAQFRFSRPWRSIRKYNDRPESSPEVVELMRREVQKITPEKWQNCVRHIKKVELSFQTTSPERMIIINVTNSSDSNND
jgi:hypothetical protein